MFSYSCNDTGHVQKCFYHTKGENEMLSDWESTEKKRELGSRLQFLREQAGVTQLELSERAGCSKNYLSAVERGVNKLTVPVLLEYCKATHKTPNEILGFNQDKRLNSELLSILDTFDKEQYERAIRVLKAL